MVNGDQKLFGFFFKKNSLGHYTIKEVVTEPTGLL